ncbi:hypothetical protein [Cohnella herbarum]|uniref:Uncharacterized protein n=1 Tax=Cohnella herbarum TaxID=2728023 RepID=A0A7Z2ZQ00_9BACL|nr:hypothetical protein [Cohnella herbarum]QJD87878.1 hypothetical protein HH215_34930 [Cohnella herbarum]
MDELQKAREEIAVASESRSKRISALIRFVSVLVDQASEANLTPDEMRYVGAVFKKNLDLFAGYEERR